MTNLENGKIKNSILIRMTRSHKLIFENNHLKLLETFCLDDKQFTCWMCHNYNFSDDHRGHKVVGLEEAYRILRTENIGNFTFLKSSTLVIFKIDFDLMFNYFRKSHSDGLNEQICGKSAKISQQMSEQNQV